MGAAQAGRPAVRLHLLTARADRLRFDARLRLQQRLGERAQQPLCQASDGTYGTTQYHAQAYPGLRQLELLSKLGASAVAASICPRNLHDPDRPDHAYDPAVQAIVDRLKQVIE
jgi:hypothetical protein